MARETGHDLTTDDKFELLIAALTQRPDHSITKDDLAEILGANATQLRKAMKPENDENPNVSVFHPGGGPHEPLPFECLVNGFPVQKSLETHHDRELELLRQVRPGEFTVICKDASTMVVTVTAERDANGTITKLEIRVPASRETKGLIPPLFVLLYQLVHPDNPKKRFMEAMTAHLNIMFPETAA